MAKFFPDFNNIDRLRVPPTEGERSLLEYLNVGLDDTFEVYFNPFLDGDRPDVIILKKGYGAEIIEIKDWSLCHYQVDSNNRWIVSTPHSTANIRSPHQQVFKYKTNMFDLHLPVLGLCEALNANFFKVINVFVYFHKANKLQLQLLYEVAIKNLKDRINENNECFRDKKIVHALYENRANYLQNKLAQLNRDLAISITPDLLKKKLIKIKSMAENPLFRDEIYNEFKRRLSPPSHVLEQGLSIFLDKKQIRLSESKPGFVKIKGVAGCGKTSILVQRAVNAYRRHKNDVLILTFNLTLKPYIRDRLSQLLRKSTNEDFEVSNYHQFFNSKLNELNINVATFMSKQKDKGLSEGKMLDELYKNDSFFHDCEINKYQTILIDEVQDYEPEWVKIIREYFLAEDGEMVLFGDPAQNIYQRDEKKRESSIVKGFGRWEELTKSYRSSLDTPLVHLFNLFQKKYLVCKYEGIGAFDSSYIQGQISMNYDLIKYEEYDAPINYVQITEKILQTIRKCSLVPNDITIICSKIEVLIEVNALINANEKTMIMFETREEDEHLYKKYDEKDYEKARDKLRRRKKNFFMQNSGLIKLSTIHSFKGLEAQSIFLILLENDDPEVAYTAITRAKNNLFIFDSVHSQYGEFFNIVINNVKHGNSPVRETVL